MITVFGEGRGFRVVWLLEEMRLAYHVRANALVSRDNAVLGLKTRAAKFGMTILNVPELIAFLTVAASWAAVVPVFADPTSSVLRSSVTTAAAISSCTANTSSKVRSKVSDHR